MSLRLSNFREWLEGGSKNNYLEIRLGEQYALPINLKTTGITPIPIDISTWTFSCAYELYTADFVYDTDGNLIRANNFTPQQISQTFTGLEVTNINGPAGTATLKIPSGMTPSPNSLVTADGENTLLNLIVISCSFPSDVAGFNNIRKLLLGLILRIG